MESTMNRWLGMTVAQALAWCGASYDDVDFIDDPPGKLRAVEFDCARCEPPARLRVDFAYHAALFSRDLDWPADLVGAQAITAVRQTPLRTPGNRP